MNYKAFFILTAFIFTTFLSFSYSQRNDVALISGTCKDDVGTSMALELRFVTPGMMPAITRSNSDGTFQQVVKQGKTYLPLFKGYMELGGFHFFDVALQDKYFEFQKEFILLPIEVGKELTSSRFFEKGDTILSKEGRDFLAVFKEFFALNKNINCNVILSAPMTFFKSKRVFQYVEVKGKKKKKRVTISAKQLEEEFLQARVNQLTTAVKEIGLPTKVFNYEFEYPKKVNKLKKGETVPNNIRVVIGKVVKI